MNAMPLCVGSSQEQHSNSSTLLSSGDTESYTALFFELSFTVGASLISDFGVLL